jgi:hypothetical protein
MQINVKENCKKLGNNKFNYTKTKGIYLNNGGTAIEKDLIYGPIYNH